MIEILAIVLAITVAIVAGNHTFRFFFEDSDDFWECVRFSFTPDLFSLFRGEYLKDIGKSTKLSLFIIVNAAAGGLTYYGISSLGN